MELTEFYFLRAAKVNEGLRNFEYMIADLIELSKYFEAAQEKQKAIDIYKTIKEHYSVMGDQEKTDYWQKKIDY